MPPAPNIIGATPDFCCYICTVPVTRISISEFLLQAPEALVLDVRSPGEYEHGHFPGALSMPLFSNEERALVGTAYKQESREQAIKIGLDFFGPKMRAIISETESLLRLHNPENAAHPAEQSQTGKQVLLYCWRGGMRSGAIAWLLDLYGFRVSVLIGGYKAFRNEVLRSFELPYRFRILGGYTGSGKTELLHELKLQGCRVVDLEGIAGHKGSAFGNIGLPPQPSQEHFENLLVMELRKVQPEVFSSAATTTFEKNEQGEDAPWSSLSEISTLADTRISQKETVKTRENIEPLWLEDESQRIGGINLPGAFWKTMREASVFFVDIPFEKRLEHLVEEYGMLDRVMLADAIGRISKRLGGLQTKTALQSLEENDIPACFSILLSYYDKHYGKGLVNRENIDNLLINIPCADVDPKNALLLIKKTQ